jgi:CheY-like chemotaxis protein
MILEGLLQDSYDLTSARSGAGCLQQVELQKPDLILLDVNMPDISRPIPKPPKYRLSSSRRWPRRKS